MKRLFPWLLSLGLGLGVGCSPKNPVKPGAPVLTTLTIVDSAGPTDITGTEEACGTTTKDGGDCNADPKDPKNDKQCRSTSSWCRCMGIDQMMPAKGVWKCLFDPTSVLVATFDRILDTVPLDYEMDPEKPMGRTDVASFMSAPGNAPGALVDYVSNGASDSLIFRLFAGITGPRLLISGSPTLPSGSTLTLTLDKTKIRGKDHVSFFEAQGALKDGILTFATAPFSVGIDVPVGMPPDAGTPDPDAAVDAAADAEADAADAAATLPDASLDALLADGADDGGDSGTDGGAGDTVAETTPEPPPPAPIPVPAEMQAVTITFNNLTDTAATPALISVTANGTAYADVVIKDTKDGGTRVYTVTPKTTWPKAATLVVTVSADAADVQGVKLGSPASATFATEP